MAHVRKLLALTLLFLTFVVAGCDSEAPAIGKPPAANQPAQQGQQQPTSGKPASETMKITVYHATPDAVYLVPEIRIVPKNDHPAKTAVEMLLGEPQAKELVRILPQGVRLKGLTVKDHIAYVDFDDKIIKNNVGGSATERLIVGAVVNTLTEFPDIQKVQILVEGKIVETLTGHMDVSHPLSRSESIIKKN